MGMEFENKQYVLEAKADNVRNVSSALKAINFKESAVWFATEAGLKVVVEESKNLQANAFIGSDIFEEFNLKDEETTISFRVDLNSVVDCLTMFDGCAVPGATTAIKILYEGEGSPLTFVLDEEGIITECILKSVDDCDIMDIEISDEDVACKMILKGEEFLDVISDLDCTSDYVDFIFSPEAPNFRLSTKSSAGPVQINIQKTSNIMESFTCAGTIKGRYFSNQIKACLRSLLIATKVSIRTNAEGLMCWQFMIKTESKQYCYVEYYCLPLTEDEM